MDKKLVMLAILDGWGINDKEEGNAVRLAKTPNLDSIMKQNPSNVMHTSGLNVGLPDLSTRCKSCISCVPSSEKLSRTLNLLKSSIKSLLINDRLV